MLGSVEQGPNITVSVEVDVLGVLGVPHLELVVAAGLIQIEVGVRLHVVLPDGNSAHTELGQEGGLANCDQRLVRCLRIKRL